jgi:hypothetical protein
LFDPIAIGTYQQEFVDGALKHNNPIEMADYESSNLWPEAKRMIISIGTGSAPGKPIDGNLLDLVQRLKDIVLESEERSDSFIRGHRDMVRENRLFRFNVLHTLGDIGLEEYKAVPRITALTGTYLRKPDVSSRVDSCVDSMIESSQSQAQNDTQGLIPSL